MLCSQYIQSSSVGENSSARFVCVLASVVLLTTFFERKTEFVIHSYVCRAEE